MNFQHQSNLIQLSNILPNEILRMINEYLHNPYENIMKKVFNDINYKNYELNQSYELIKEITNNRYNCVVNQLNDLKKKSYWGYRYNTSQFNYTPSKIVLHHLLQLNNINSNTMKGFNKLNKKQLIQLLLKL